MTPSPASAGRDRLAVLLGPSDELRAEIFIRAAVPPGPGMPRLGGTLAGPRCSRASTLPAVFQLTEVPPAAVPAAAIARAVLTEPSYWTPDLPHLYRLQASLSAGDRTVATFDLLVGLRRSGIRGRSFWLDGRRWVPRGVGCAGDACQPEKLREAALAAVVVDPPPALCRAADEAGLPIIGLLEGQDGEALDAGTAADRIATWALHPSVVMAVIPVATALADVAAIAAAARSLKGTLLVGAALDGARQPPADVPQGIDCLLVHLGDTGLPHDDWRERAPALPLVAWRGDRIEPHASRRDCDALQADLAAWGLATGAERLAWEWAGYVVT